MSCPQSSHFRANEGMCGVIHLRRREELPSRWDQFPDVATKVLANQRDVEGYI
jgi:hypothetical protein